MLMAEQKPYALMVQPDDILISPREVNDNFGTMVCFHRRYQLGDSHNYIDKDDFLREMYLNTVGNDERGMQRYERMVNMAWSRHMTGDHPDPRAVDDRMLRVISEKYLMLPLYLYDHSGLALRTESFIGKAVHAEWDSGQVGWIYVSKEAALKEFGGEKMTGAIRKQAAVFPKVFFRTANLFPEILMLYGICQSASPPVCPYSYRSGAGAVFTLFFSGLLPISLSTSRSQSWSNAPRSSGVMANSR